MLFGDIDIRRYTRNLALSFGVDFEAQVRQILYNIQNMRVQDDSKNEFVRTSNLFEPLTNLHTKIFTQHSIAYAGIGHVIDPNNKFVFPILRGSPSTISVDNSSGSTKENTSKLTLVSGFQSLTNHRATVTGSMSVCSDEVMA